MAPSLERSVAGTRARHSGAGNIWQRAALLQGGRRPLIGHRPAPLHARHDAMTVETAADPAGRPSPILKTRARPVGAGDMRAGARAGAAHVRHACTARPGSALPHRRWASGCGFAVVDLMADDKPAPIVLINPEIVARSEELATREEGCLSLPGQYADVTRPARVTVRYTTPMAPGGRSRRTACWPPACSTRSTIWTGCCSSITSRR